MTIKSASQYIVDQIADLYEAGEAQAIAGWVIEDLTGLDTLSLRMQREAALTQTQLDRMVACLQQLRQYIPVQYVLGKSYFFGYTFMVSPAVLIPRPETEELVDLVLQYVRQRKGAPLRVLEVGAGSGCISIALKKQAPQLDTTAVDIATDALAIARQNAASLQAEVNFIECDFLDEAQWPGLGTFDIIVSNPPYITEQEQASMQTHVLEQEPHAALFVTDGDPQQFYRKIAHFAGTHLQTGGAVFLELNQYFAADTKALYSAAGWQADLLRDLNDNDRMLRCTR
jgi:release factor glutamine methyltransferase